MPEETARYLKNKQIMRAAVLATDGTIRSGIYDRALKNQGIEPVYPDPEGQRLVMRIIYEFIKAGREEWDELIPETEQLLVRLQQARAGAVILGCTELPVAFKRLAGRPDDLEYIDPTVIAARAAIVMAGAAVTELDD